MELKDAIAHAREVAESKRKTIKEVYENLEEDRPLFEEQETACLECAEEHEQLAAWLTELQERRQADEWISVEDRLPDKNGNYLVLLNNGEMTTDIFDEEELFMGFWGYMTHWRPLPPKPYKESEAQLKSTKDLIADIVGFDVSEIKPLPEFKESEET